MTRWTFTLREVHSRPGRAILTLLSVVLGVAALVATTTASRATRQAYQDMYRIMAGRAALEVVAEGGGAYEQDIAQIVEEIPGVVAAVPILQRPTIVYLPNNERVQATLLAFEPDRYQAVRDFDLVEGEFFHSGSGILLDAGFAHSAGVRVGDNVRLPLSKRRKLIEATVVGLLSPREASQFGQGGSLFVSLKNAQNLLGVGRKVDTTHVVLSRESQEEIVRAEIAKGLPTGLRVQRPGSRTQLAEKTLASSEQGLQLATSLSLVIALFIIFNTFLMNVSERRRHLSIMRAIGATQGQISGMMLTEGLTLGVIGTTIGILVGVIGAQFLTRMMGALMNVDLAYPGFSVWPCMLGSGFGLLVSLAGVYFPARKASRVSPLEGMCAVPIEDREGPSRLMSAVGAIVTVATLMLQALTVYGKVPPSMSPWTAALFMVGTVLLAPSALPWLSSCLAPFLNPLLRFEGRLARTQLLRRRLRTGLTVGVLFVAIASGIGLGNATFDNIHDIHRWYSQTVLGDFFVRAMLPDLAAGEIADMPEEFGDTLRNIPGVNQVDMFIVVRAEVHGESAVILANDGGNAGPLRLDLIEGHPDEVRRRMQAGEVVASTVLSERLGVKSGDALEIATRQGIIPFRIAALCNEYSFGGAVLHLDFQVARQAFGIEGADAFALSVTPEKKPDVERTLKDLCVEEGLLLQSNSDLKRLVDGMISGVTGSLYVLLVLGFIVAAFGIVNTLTMNVLEQTREIGMLRTVAMTRWQVRKLILSQAAIMGMVGLAPGALIGLALSFLMNLCMPAVLGHHVQFVLRPSLLTVSFASALLIVIVAALLPAERAARLDMRTAMQTG